MDERFQAWAIEDIVDRAADRYYLNFVQGKLLFRAEPFEFQDGVAWCEVTSELCGKR